MINNENSEQIKNGENLYEFWKRENPKKFQMEKRFTFISVFVFILILALCLIAYFCVLRPWFKDVSLAMILHYKQSITYIALIACCLIILSPICDIYVFFSNYSQTCAKWVRKKQINVNEAFQKDVPVLFPEGIEGKCAKSPLAGAYYCYFKNCKLHDGFLITSFLGSVATSASLFITLSVELCDYIRNVAGGGSTSFEPSFMRYIPFLIIALIWLMVMLVYKIMMNKTIEGYLRAKAKEVNASKKIG